MNRRCAIVEVDIDILAKIVNLATDITIDRVLCPDTTHYRDRIRLLVSSPRFDVVEEASVLPLLTLWWKTQPAIFTDVKLESKDNAA